MLAQLTRLLTLILPTVCLFFAQQASPEAFTVFRSDSKLVLLSFNVIRGIYFAPDVKPGDVALLEDGKPRGFTIFEGPGGGNRPPLELVLLFDTTTLPLPDSKTTVKWTHWDRNVTYAFTTHWGDRESGSVLKKGGEDVRVSVYRYDHQQLQRLCSSTKDPQTLTSAIRRLPEPIHAPEAMPLTLPKDRMTQDDFSLKHGGFKRDPKAPILWPLSWTLEAVIDTLNDSTSTPSNAMRALIVFSETVGPTTTRPEDVVDVAMAHGIRVYPVVLDFDEYVRHPFVRLGGSGGVRLSKDAVPLSPNAMGNDPAANSGPAADPSRIATNGSTPPMVWFGSLGELTGGASLYPSRLDVETVNHILNVIRDESLSSYVVGFVPPPPGRQRKHELEIRLKSKSTGKLIGGKKTAVY